MNWFRPICSISLQNFRKWKYDYRVWIALLIMLVFVHSYTNGLSSFCDYVNIKSSPWIFPFLYTQYYVKLLFFFPLILIFSNAPFVDNNELYVIIRSGRIKWSIAQILYIIISTAIYFFLVILFSIIFNLNIICITDEWGKVLNTLANTDAADQFNIGFKPDKNIINLFSPIQAMWFTFLHSWISGIILGLIIFLFNMIFKGFGTFISSIVLVFSAIASKELSLVKYSPVTWSTLNYLHIHINDNFPSYGYIGVFYSVSIFLLILAIVLVSKNYDIDKALKR